MVFVSSPGLTVSSNPAYAPGSAPAFDGGGFLPNSLSGGVLWLDAADRSTLTFNFQSITETATGTISTNTITASADVSAKIEIGNSIQIAGTDLYTVTNVVTDTITTQESLVASYSADTIEVAHIVQWDDKSGNNNNATQGSAVSQPAFINNALNGKSIIRSDGNDGMEFPNLGLTGLASVTVFMVLNISDSSSGFDSILAFGSGSESRLETGAGGGATIGDVTARSTSYIVSGTVLSTGFNNSNNIFVLRTDGANVIARKNGVQTFSAAQAGNWSTGAGNYAIFVTNTPNRNIIMDIGEILIYTGTFPTTSIIQVENYLSNKWGI